MLSEHERDQAIKEGARNAADSAYFNGRPHLADDTGIRVFDAGFDRGWDAATAPLLARIAEQDALIATLRLEAQIHAQEARTANATIAEIYQSVTGGTGEPGNWHGAAPVKARIAELERHNNELVKRREFDVRDIKDSTAKLVALTRELEEARKDAAAEREECAKVCKDEMIDEERCNDDVAYNAGCNDCAAAIRARGTK